MTVVIKLGRRLPRAFAKRLIAHGKNWLSLQEQIWLFIVKAFQSSKKAADNRPEEQVIITIQNKVEFEDLKYQVEWKIITVSSIIHAKEVEEYEEAMKIYSKFNLLKALMGKKIDSDESLKETFKSSVVTPEQFEKAKEAGYGAVGEQGIAEKLLELGIMTIIENDWVKN